MQGIEFRCCRPGRAAAAAGCQVTVLRSECADNLYFHTVIKPSVPSAGPELWPGLWENSQDGALRLRPGPVLRRAHWHRDLQVMPPAGPLSGHTPTVRT